jgi:hypothetical protein
MKLWSYIELEGWEVVAKKINDWVDRVHLPDMSNLLDWTYLDVDQFNAEIPELKEMLDKYNITPLGYGLLAFYQDESPIHTDLENPTIYRLNIPIRHTEHSITEYFEVPPEEMLTTAIGKTNIPTPYTWWEEKSVIRKLDEFALTKPVVLQVHQAHKVTIHSIPKGQARLSLTICPTNDEQLLKLIK